MQQKSGTIFLCVENLGKEKLGF